ncbi:MAG: hypothetical protein SNJ78_08030 [Spirochaetales bacterium]
MMRLAFLLSLFIFVSFYLPSQPTEGVIRENYEVRLDNKNLFNAPLHELARFQERIFSQRTEDHRVRVAIEKTDEAYYILFLNEEHKGFPIYSSGSWVVKRDNRTGAVVQAKIFFRSDAGCFIRLFPQGERTRMEVYLYDTFLYKSVPLGTSLSILLTEPLKEIVRLTSVYVNWSTLLKIVPSQLYSSSIAMVQRIRQALPYLPDAEDGAMDKEGKLVHISSLRAQESLPGFNCSGFAKWVADGIYYPRQGEYLDIEALREKHLSKRGSRITERFEQERDPFFGLDWTRNIARILAGGKDPESRDVRQVPHWKYREDIGFPVQELESLLFYLAIIEPGTFYLGSVNREFGSTPVLRQHIHVVVLFPFFTGKNEFKVVVFERNVETDLSSLKRRYRDDFIHLVRVEADSNFQPPRIE